MSTEEKARRPIGQILIDGGFIEREDLELALEVQKHSNELLGQVLVNMGVLDKADLEAALSIQDHLSTIDDAVRSAARHQLFYAGDSFNGHTIAALRRQPDFVSASVLVFWPSRSVYRRAARLRHRL